MKITRTITKTEALIAEVKFVDGNIETVNHVISVMGAANETAIMKAAKKQLGKDKTLLLKEVNTVEKQYSCSVERFIAACEQEEAE